MTLCSCVRPSARAVPSEKDCYVFGFLVLAIVSAVALGVSLFCGDSRTALLALADILIGLAGMGFVAMDYL